MSEITEQKQTLREALLVITNAAVVPSISLKAVKAAKDATVLLDAVKMELDHYGNEVLCLDDPRFPFWAVQLSSKLFTICIEIVGNRDYRKEYKTFGAWMKNAERFFKARTYFRTS